MVGRGVDDLSYGTHLLALENQCLLNASRIELAFKQTKSVNKKYIKSRRWISSYKNESFFDYNYFLLKLNKKCAVNIQKLVIIVIIDYSRKKYFGYS